MLKKTVLILAIVLALIVAGFSIYAYSSVIEFTDEQESEIEAAIQNPITKQVGEEGYALNGDTKIWYDVQNPKDSIQGSIVLIMGLSADALAWPSFFMDGFLDAGYQVIRLDNRGVGMTDWDSFNPENPYSLSDMSDDVIAILDTLGIEKAHIAGASMGGMIGQTLCIEHPERAQSLTSMMSTPWVNDKELPTLNYSCFAKIGANTFQYGLSNSEADAVKMGLAIRTILLGSDTYKLDIERITAVILYNLRERKGPNRQAGQQQIAAIEKSGSRIEALKSLQVPTLVIHGKTDPLIPIEHGMKTAELIPNVQTLWLDGLGHTISPTYSDTIVSRMVGLMNSINQKPNAIFGMKYLLSFFLLSCCFFNVHAQDNAFQLFNSKGKKVKYSKMLKSLDESQIILFGEYHDNPISHWLQFEVTSSLLKNNQLILGSEVIEADNQKELNQYLKGEIDAKGLDSLARLWINFKTDYKPLVDLAKDNNLKFVATNVPRRYASMVYRGGFEVLDTLSEEEKSWIAPLPFPYDSELPGYAKMLEMMGGHGGENLPKAQAIKDATMAHFILANYAPEQTFIHYNGAYHSNNYEGILWYLKQAKPDYKYATISTVSQANISKLKDENKGLADFIICVDENMTSTH